MYQDRKSKDGVKDKQVIFLLKIDGIWII